MLCTSRGAIEIPASQHQKPTAVVGFNENFPNLEKADYTGLARTDKWFNIHRLSIVFLCVHLLLQVLSHYNPWYLFVRDIARDEQGKLYEHHL